METYGSIKKKEQKKVQDFRYGNRIKERYFFQHMTDLSWIMSENAKILNVYIFSIFLCSNMRPGPLPPWLDFLVEYIRENAVRKQASSFLFSFPSILFYLKILEQTTWFDTWLNINTAFY